MVGCARAVHSHGIIVASHRRRWAKAPKKGSVVKKNNITVLNVWIVETSAEGDIAVYLSFGEADSFAETHTELTKEKCSIKKRKAIVQFTRSQKDVRKSA